MYGHVLWQNQSKKIKEENLPKAVGKKVTFQQLVVCYIKFQFKCVCSGHLNSYIEERCFPVEAFQPSSCWSACKLFLHYACIHLHIDYLQKDEETAESNYSSSSESEDEELSEMELKRQRNMHRNSLAWDEITKVCFFDTLLLKNWHKKNYALALPNY